MTNSTSGVPDHAFYMFHHGFRWSGVAGIAFMVFIVPSVVFTLILRHMKKRGKLGYRHRKMLNSLLELLILSELLVLTTAQDFFADVFCSPDVLLERLGPDGWITGASRCAELTAGERDAVNCDFAGPTSAFTGVLAGYAGLLTFLGGFIYSQEGNIVSGFQSRGFGVLLLINSAMFYVLFMYTYAHQGECRVGLGVHGTCMLFIILSYGLVILEYFIPNSPDFHTIESDPQLAAKLGLTDADTTELIRRHPAGEANDDFDDSLEHPRIDAHPHAVPDQRHNA